MTEKQSLQIALGKRIKQLRLNKNISQQDMAAFCNFETPNYCRIESGRTNPTIYTLYLIAKNLQVSLTELIEVEL
mgnify:CR=1 FL=1